MPELVSMYYPEKNNDKKIVEVKVNYTRDASVSERLEKARIRVIDRLEELEAVERNTAADGTDFLVVDQVRLLEVFDKRMLESASSVVWKDSGNLVVSAFNVFEGVPVVEKQEFEDADDEIVLKNLFYVPESAQTVYEADAISQSCDQSLMGLWKVGNKIKAKENLAYPTQDQGFESGVSFVQAAIAAEVWGFGKAYEDFNHDLMVKEGNKFVRITGEWLGSKLGFKKGEDGADIQDRPREAVGKTMQALVNAGLMKEEYFDSVRRTENLSFVQTNGLVTLVDSEGILRRYTLGREFSGATVHHLHGDRFAVMREGITRVIDIGGVKSESMTLRNMGSGRRIIDVDQAGVVFVEDLHAERIISMHQEFGRPIVEKLPQGLQENVCLWREHLLNSADIIDVTSAELATCYFVEALDNISRWSQVLYQSMSEIKGSEKGRAKLFLDRVIESYATQTMEALQGCLAYGPEDERWQKMDDMVNLSSALVAIFSGESDYQCVYIDTNRVEQKSAQISSLTLKFRNNLGEEVKITFRPMRDENRGADACIRVGFKGNEGKTSGLRLDLADTGRDFKTTMDNDVLKDMGLDHHNDVVFDAAFSDPSIFAEVVRLTANALNANAILANKHQEWA